MDTENEEIPAFPSQAGYDYKGQRVTNTSEGMTLRDYFAAKAMQGIVARNGQYGCSVISHAAYEMADAMLEERKK